ncbi:hypothetical protein B0H13DRAFT_2318143 [Mycena leptocephala]|nr:hypothetical protein B0H13DRAFT_2318143 [Mycena leptocephala]
MITALTLMGPASGPAAESGRILNQPAAPNLASVTSDSDACMAMTHGAHCPSHRRAGVTSNIERRVSAAHLIAHPQIVSRAQAGEQRARNTPSVDRGLAFVAYQASIFNGFMFLQSIWINNIGFIFGKVDPTIGVDPIIGTLGGGPKNISELDPLVPVDESVSFHDDPWNDVVVPTDYVISRGGEYFFSPSLSGLGAIAAA